MEIHERRCDCCKKIVATKSSIFWKTQKEYLTLKLDSVGEHYDLANPEMGVHAVNTKVKKHICHKCMEGLRQYIEERS